MKWFGALMIVVTTTSFGLHIARQLGERPRQLRQLKVALQSLEAEMMYGLTPLALASERIAAQVKKPLALFFTHFANHLKNQKATAFEAWQEAIELTWDTTALLQSEKEVMMQLGATLGQHDRQQQEKQIQMTLIHLEREEKEAKEIQLRYERMVRSLGFLTGLLIVILLM